MTRCLPLSLWLTLNDLTALKLESVSVKSVPSLTTAACPKTTISLDTSPRSPYHGWAFDGEGKLRDVPSADAGTWPKRPLTGSYSVSPVA